MSIDSVFAAVSEARARLGLRAWGLAHTTLEDVFISIATEDEGKGEEKGDRHPHKAAPTTSS